MNTDSIEGREAMITSGAVYAISTLLKMTVYQEGRIQQDSPTSHAII